MNKTEMAKKLAGKTDLSQAKAAEVIDTIFSSEDGKGIIAVELDAGRDVSIAGFGKFETRHRKARAGRNPATGRNDSHRCRHGSSVQGRKGPQGPRPRLGSRTSPRVHPSEEQTEGSPTRVALLSYTGLAQPLTRAQRISYGRGRFTVALQTEQVIVGSNPAPRYRATADPLSAS